MKNKLFIIPFFSAFFILLIASAGLSEQVSRPRIFFEEKDFDAKEIRSGNYLEHSFKVYNKGDGILEISRVQTG